MKTSDTSVRYVLLFVLSVGLIWASTAFGADKFKLKPGAKGKICLKCHEDFKKTLERTHLHPLLKDGECAACHDPHTSWHEELLAEKTTTLCIGCHAKVLPDKTRSSHDVVQTGDCKKCHDAHGSQNPSILLKPGKELCVECHEDVGNQVKTSRFRHRPLQTQKGCLTCHNPHASEKFDALLHNEAPGLCTKCHETNKGSFKNKHMNYSVADSNCVSCHDPHGSSRKGMLFDDAHVPVKKKQCAMHYAGNVMKGI
jgi:predicted CXXCH cytochrome family protein